jgi:hypothetical protein
MIFRRETSRFAPLGQSPHLYCIILFNELTLQASSTKELESPKSGGSS